MAAGYNKFPDLARRCFLIYSSQTSPEDLY